MWATLPLLGKIAVGLWAGAMALGLGTAIGVFPGGDPIASQYHEISAP